MAADERSRAIEQARYAELAERYEDMAESMKKLVKTIDKCTFDIEERNLLSVAYKHLVGPRRSALRILRSVKKERDLDATYLAVGKEYTEKIEAELKTLCLEVLGLIDKLLKNDTTPNSIVFYHKMKADYYRYLAEFAPTEEYKTGASDAYEAAHEEACKTLTTTDPTRLGLALNYSVFYYEIMESHSKACQLAKQAFDDAITDISTVADKDYKDSTLIMQLLRDNLTLWTAQDSDNEGDKDEDKDGAQ